MNSVNENNFFSMLNDIPFVMPEPEQKVTHYKLDDGRFWDIANAKFVGDLSEDAVVSPCYDSNSNSTLEGLISCLEQNSFPKGELKTDAEYASEAREKRNALIAETDFMLMPDYPLSNEKRQAVSAYRQSLRDIPEQSGFPRNINWPEKNF